MTVNECKELTKDMVKVMQAYIDGKKIICRPQPTAFQDDTWCDTECPAWDWSDCEYAINEDDNEEFIDNIDFSKLKEKFYDNVKKHEERLSNDKNKALQEIANSIEKQTIEYIESGSWDMNDFRWVLGDTCVYYFGSEGKETQENLQTVVDLLEEKGIHARWRFTNPVFGDTRKKGLIEIVF